MKKRADRAMADLYDRTEKIPRVKMEGSTCKEPLDQPVNKPEGISENNKSPSRKRSFPDDDNPHIKPESGTCNVCNTPCTSCLHRMRVETDSCSAVGTCSERFHCEDAETNSKLQNPNKTKPFDIGIVKQEGQGESSSCITKHSKEKDTQKGDSHRELCSANSTEESQEKKGFNFTDSRESDSNLRVSQKNSARNEKMFSRLENCDKKDFADKDQKAVEVKNQENDNGLIDVNVCDICGDTGREYLLATCSRCIDGAEHTYCMRVRLEKLPEGDWLCEECQIREKSEKKQQRHAEATPLSPPVSEKENKSDLVNSKNPFSRNKKLRISKNDAVYAPVVPPSPYKSCKELISPGKSSYLSRENLLKKEICSPKEVISPRKTTNLSRENSMKMEICSPKGSSGVQSMKKSFKEVISPGKTSKLCRENSMKMDICSPKGSSGVRFVKKSSKEVISPRKTGNLFRENSMKMEICSPKGSSGGQFMKRSQLLSRSYSLNHVSSLKDADKGQTTMLPPKGTMTKHLSFKGLSMKKKVKSITASNPTKQRTSSSSLLKPTDEPRTFRRLIKSASFKEASSSRANPDTVKLTKPLSPTVQIETQMRAEKEKSSLGKMDFKGEKHNDVLAQQHSTTISKFENKAEGSLPKKPKHGTSCSHVEPAVRDNKMSKTVLAKQHQANKKSKSILASKGSDKNFDRLKTAVKTVIPEAIIDGGNNGISDKPKVPISQCEVPQTSKNQKRISTNVEEQSRSTFSEKSRVEKVSKDVLSLTDSLKKEELTDLDVICPKVGVQKMEVPDMLSRPSSWDKRKPDNINVNTTEPRVEKTKASKDTLPPYRSLEKCMNSNGMSDHVKNVEVKPNVPAVVQDSFLLGTSSETMVIPEQDFVWQGSFDVLQAKTQAYESFNGIQAHFSTHVSHKVFEVMAKFSDKLQLEEVPWGTAWPLQSQEIEPSEEHIALFFFARDLESYEVSYSRLLQNLIGNNLALRGYISGSELLIFPSDKLPHRSQRWNSIFYLWGIFCARQQVLPEKILNSCKPIGGSSGNLLAKTNEYMKSCKVLSIGDNLPKLKVKDGVSPLDVGLESYKIQAVQNSSVCLEPNTCYTDSEIPNANQTARTTKICVVKAEDAAENMTSPPILERKMADKISDDNKILLLGEESDAELKPRNKHAHLSDETSQFSLKRKWGQYDFKFETGYKSSTLLEKSASPKTHPLSIDLEKPADACDVYSTEDVVGTSLRDVEKSKTGNRVSNVISSEDEDAAENKVPNLNLALGNKNPSQKDVRPLTLFPLVQSEVVEKEVSLSLSLTIEPPGSGRELESPVVKMQQFLPEKPVEKAPIRLFGGYISP